MPAIRQQVQELIDEIRGTAHPGEPFSSRAHHVAREAADVVAYLVDSFDADNQAADLARLEVELREIAQAFIDEANLGIGIRRMAITALPWVLPPLLEQAAEYGGNGAQWLQNVVVPHVDETIETLQVWRTAFAGTPRE